MTSQLTHRRLTDDETLLALSTILSSMLFEIEYARLARTPAAVRPVNPSRPQPRVLYAGTLPAEEPNFACFSEVVNELRCMKPISRNKPAEVRFGRPLTLMFASPSSGDVTVYSFDLDVRAVKLCTQPKLELRLEDACHGYIILTREPYGWVVRNSNAYCPRSMDGERHRVTRRFIPRSGTYRKGTRNGAI